MGAVGGICTSFLDEQGHVISYPSEQRMIGMSAETLRRIPNVIATASGMDKVPAICSVLRGKWVNVLVTDMATAKAVLEWHHAHPVT
ncbi:Deoxyribonucleoside regulator [compost metagenome]